MSVFNVALLCFASYLLGLGVGIFIAALMRGDR